VQNCEIYLDLSAIGILGEATAADYEQQIELRDWSWGLGLNAINNDNPPYGEGRAIKIKKPVDRATTAMLKYLERGLEISKGVLVLVGRTEKNLMVRLELEGIQLTNYTLSVGNSDLEVDLSEVWDMSYKKIKVQYVGRKDSGNDVRGKVRSLGVSSFELTVPKNAKLEPPEALKLDSDPSVSKKEVGRVRQEVARLEALISKQKSAK